MKKRGAVALSEGSKTYAIAARPFCGYIEFAGIHTDPSFAPEGTAFPQLDVRSDDRTSQTKGLSGCRSCSPHSLLRSGRIRFIQPLIQSNPRRGMPQPLRLILTLNACMEGMDLSEIYQTYTRVPKNLATPKLHAART